MPCNSVYIVDDDPSVRDSLKLLLEQRSFLPRTFPDSGSFLAESASLSPGCVLLDIRMPDIDGIEVLERLHQDRCILPVVVMTGHGDVITAVRVMKLGACDFVEKPLHEAALLDVLSRCFAILDGAVRDVSRQDNVRLRLERLSHREREVLIALLAGRQNKQIAHDLDISVRTVEMHRAGMMDRLGVRTLAEALRLAIEGDLINVSVQLQA